MRHKVYGKHLGRDTNQRTALFRGLIRSLILHESITTTDSKAKSIKGLVDRVISKAKDSSNASQRVLESILPQKQVREKLLAGIVPQVQGRTSGFTQTVRLGRRLGDGAMMVKMSLIKEESENPKVPSKAMLDEGGKELNEESGSEKMEAEQKKEVKKAVKKITEKKESK